MINVILTQNLRLTADTHNFIVEERVLIDPTRAPGYRPQAGVEPPPVREDWREVAYYPQKSVSLPLIVDFVAMRTVARSDAETLAEFVRVIRDEYQRVTDTINALIQPSES